MSEPAASTPTAAELLPEITDHAIILRPLTIEDAAAHLAGEDDELIRWLSGGRGSMETVLPWIERNLASWRGGGPIFNFGIRECSSGELVGNVEANLSGDLDGVAPGEANIAYGLFPAGRGRGYATRAVTLLCDFLAGRGVPGAVIRAEAANERSLGVAQRSGFRYSGDIVTRDGATLACYRRSLTPQMEAD